MVDRSGATAPAEVIRRAPGTGGKGAAPAGDGAATPMMVQYLAIKRAHPDCLLFYRMGDFYELFFADAALAAAALDITLTHRGRHDGARVPMCGVPVRAAESYLLRLIRKGFRVAVCEQAEDPAQARKRGNKSVVAREVVRIVTPGTITEDALLDARRHNYLAALAGAGGDLGLAWLDLSTGEFSAQSVTSATLGAALARLDPGEFLVSERLLQNADLFEIFAEWKAVLTPGPAGGRNSEAARRRLAEIYKVTALEAFGDFSRAEIAACGAVVDYVELTQKGRLPLLGRPRRMSDGFTLVIDAATRRNLELTHTLSGAREGSLLSVIDRTTTGAGGRLIAARLAAPLTDPAAIAERCDGVAYFVDDAAMRENVRTMLARCSDIERALSRIALGRGAPRDLAAIRDGLGEAAALRTSIEGTDTPPPTAVAAAVQGLGFHGELVDRLCRALAPELPAAARDGGFIATGYSDPLDELRTLRDESRRLIANLQRRYGEETGVATLKIRHNNVIGYFIEVTPAHADKVATGEEAPFIHRQTLAGAVRFTTVELGELETRIGRAADQALALELELFEDLVDEVVARADAVASAARALAALDVAAALAQLAIERRYVRPVIDDSSAFGITGGRHPVVEAALEDAHQPAFVANDCDLAPDRRLWVVTGPNMAGKSTFLRQNALIVILAQMGSFVPADAVHLGVVDRLFSRVGAADDLARGRSTFMVEMVETAAILNQAGPRALIILDEIGRGTATYDGLSIAWATLEQIHQENRCRTLFATHFHELTQLAARLEALRCHTMRVKEWRGEVVFLHEVIPGTADRSYGIHVARLAGLPGPVLVRAEEVLRTLEQGEEGGAITRLADDLPLFQAAPATPPPPAGRSAMEAALGDINPDALTPQEALELLYRLKALSED